MTLNILSMLFTPIPNPPFPARPVPRFPLVKTEHMCYNSLAPQSEDSMPSLRSTSEVNDTITTLDPLGHPSSFLRHPSAFLPHPFFAILQPSSFIPHPFFAILPYYTAPGFVGAGGE
jgi:hypothetical protein